MIRLIFLSEKFYRQYGSCREILQKPSRPYACLAVKLDGLTFAIPLRHHINHEHAFITRGSCRLDYSKAVVIPDDTYIAPGHPKINQQEFNAMKGKDKVIETGMKNYLALYRKALRYRTNPHYARILQYSSLQYFKEYL